MYLNVCLMCFDVFLVCFYVFIVYSNVFIVYLNVFECINNVFNAFKHISTYLQILRLWSFLKTKILCVEEGPKHVLTVWDFNYRIFHMLILLFIV
jgi:hypothetical protein